MTITQNKESTVQLLDQLFKHVKMSSQTLLAMLPRVESEQAKFKSELTLMLNDYESIAHRINSTRGEIGEQAEDASLMTKITARVTTAMATLMDSSVSHMAQLLIEECTRSMTDTVKAIREFENTTASEASLALAREVVTLEEKNVERLKAYL